MDAIGGIVLEPIPNCQRDGHSWVGSSPATRDEKLVSWQQIPEGRERCYICGALQQVKEEPA